MNRPPRRQLPIPDGDAPKSGRPPPPLPTDDIGPPPPVPGRRAPPPLPQPDSDMLPPKDPLEHSDSSYGSDSDFDADSDESYEKMREKLSPPAIPNRGYRQRDELPLPPTNARSALPTPPGRSHDTSPRPPPPSRHLPTLPPVPSPGRRGPLTPPVKDEPEDVYDDGDTGEIYEEGLEPEEPEDVYDDGQIGEEEEEEYHEPDIDKPPPLPTAPRRELPPPPPQSSRPPLPEPVQDVYEVEPEPDPIPKTTLDEEDDINIYEMEPTVPDVISEAPPKIPNRPPFNPPPQETYEIEEEPEETYDEFDQGEALEVYEPVNEEHNPALPARPVPPPPPSAPMPSKATPTPPKKATQPKPTPKPPGGGGPMGGLDLSAITNVRLKKVGVPLEDRPKPVEAEKVYSEEGGVKSAFAKFQQRDLQTSGLLPFPKSSAAVASSLKKPVIPGKPDIHARPFKKQEPENKETKPISPVSKAPPSIPKPRSPSPSKDSPPIPPPLKSDKPPPVPYSQVKPSSNVTNGTRMGIQEDHPPSDEDDDNDDIYDDAISNRDPLLGEPWYFKSLKDRKTGDRLLRKVGKDGTFLIRESTKQGHVQPYTMMVLYQNNIYNLKVRVRPDGKMALGEEKPDEMSFMDVQKLVKYHRETEVILVGNTGQHKTLLKQSPPQNAL